LCRPLAQQIVTVFGEYQAAQQAAQGPAPGGPLQPVPEVVARRLDGALLAIGTLSDMLKKTVSTVITAGDVHALAASAKTQQPAAVAPKFTLPRPILQQPSPARVPTSN